MLPTVISFLFIEIISWIDENRVKGKNCNTYLRLGYNDDLEV